MTDYYKLIGKIVVPCRDVLEWATWLKTHNRIVKQDHVGPLFVSTVFLGIDHMPFRSPRHLSEDPPLVFETMIFDGNEDSYQTRCSTWEEAEFMHEVAMAQAKTLVDKASSINFLK